MARTSAKIGFLDLPREVRDMIYDHALIRPHVFVKVQLTTRHKDEIYTKDLSERTYLGPLFVRQKRPMDKKQYFYNYLRDPVCLGLLRGVCRQVQVEAQEAFYTKENHFIIGPGALIKPLTNHLGQFPPMKSVSLTFDARDLGSRVGDRLGADLLIAQTLDRDEHFWNTQWETPQRCSAHLHDCYVMDLVKCWERRMRILEAMEQLERVKLDVTMAFCPYGCCRLDRAFHHILPRFKQIPRTITLMGLSDCEEGLTLVRALLIKNKIAWEKMEKVYDGLNAELSPIMSNGEGYCYYSVRGSWMQIWLADLARHRE